MSAAPLCACGCGEPVNRIDRTWSAMGYYKGEWYTHLQGHASRTRDRTQERSKRLHEGYVLVWAPDHPRSGYPDPGRGYVQEHILVAERALGRYLPEGAVVHHVNEDRTDNRPQNLVICEDRAYHSYLHRRIRAQKESGHANWYRCRYCREWDSPENLRIYDRNRTWQATHAGCRSEDYRRRKEGAA